MNTRYLMLAASGVLVFIGSLFLFIPNEILAAISPESSKAMEFVLQVSAGAFLGLGYLDWMSRGAVIGGIYGRPLLVGNQMCFTVGALVLLRAIIEGELDPIAWVITLAFVLLAIAFGYLFYSHPSMPEE